MLKKKVKKTRLFFVFARISPPFSVHFPNCINTRMYRKKTLKILYCRQLTNTDCIIILVFMSNFLQCLCRLFLSILSIIGR